MLTLRCTRRLLRWLAVSERPDLSPSTTVLGDWYANLIALRPQPLILAMSSLTLSVVLLPARKATRETLGPLLRDAVVAHLRRLDVSPGAVAAEAEAMSEICLGPTASRSVLGCMSEAQFALSTELEAERFSSLLEIELYLNEYIYRATGYREPRELVCELFARA